MSGSRESYLVAVLGSCRACSFYDARIHRNSGARQRGLTGDALLSCAFRSQFFGGDYNDVLQATTQRILSSN